MTDHGRLEEVWAKSVTLYSSACVTMNVDQFNPDRVGQDSQCATQRIAIEEI